MNDDSIVRWIKKWVVGGHSCRRPSSARLALRELDDRIVPSASVTSVTTSGLGITAGTGAVRAGQTVTLAVNFNQHVMVNQANGQPSLTLNNGAVAAYAGGTGTSALKFSYTVAPGQDTADLAVTKFNLNGADLGGAVIGGAEINPAGTLAIDTVAPTAVIMPAGGGVQTFGSVLHFDMTFSEKVFNVDGNSFRLTTAGLTTASIAPPTRVDDLHYTIDVSPGDGAGSASLDFIPDTIQDAAGNRMGGGSFTSAARVPLPTGATAFGVVIGDVNRDGKPDLVTANSNEQGISVFLGTGTGSFGPAMNFDVGNSPGEVVIGDVNADGKPDLVAANSDGSVSVLLGTGTGSFGAATNFAVSSGPNSVAINDFNADGKPDLVTANYGGNNVSVLLGNGDGSFGAAVNFGVGSKPVEVAVSDFDGDGKPDLVTVNKGDNNVSVLLGNGDGSFGVATSFDVGPGPVSISVGDFDGDGKPDLVTANAGQPFNTTDGASVSVLLGIGDGTFGDATNYPVGTDPFSVVVGDVNGDGKPDLVTANEYEAKVSVLLGNGDGTFDTASGIDVNTAPQKLAIGDVNGDGRPDIVTASYDNGSLSVLLNNPASQAGPTFSQAIVNDGTGTDANLQTSLTTISANWIFNDASNPPAGFEWAIGSTPGGTDVQDFTGVGLVTSAVNNALSLVAGQTYYVSVRSVDNLGNPLATFNSNGVTIVPDASFLQGNTGTFTDSDGDKYTVRLTPANVGRIAVLQDDPGQTGRGPIKGILLEGADPAKSVLTVTVTPAKGGDGRVHIGDIQGADLKGVTASKSDLTGRLFIGGEAGLSTSLAFAGISAGASITTGSRIASLTAASVSAATITAPSLGTLSIKGGFAASVSLGGDGVSPGKPTLTSAVIGGVANRAVWNVGGPIGTLKAGSFAGAGSIYASSLGTLTSTGDFNSAVTLDGQGVAAGRPTLTSAVVGGVISGVYWDVTGAISSLRAKSFTGGGTISASSLGTLTTTGDFDSAVTLSGAGVAAGKLALTAATIGGNILGVDWNITGAIGSLRAKSFINGGSISAGSLGTLTTTGDFDSAVTLSRAGVAVGKPTLTTAAIGGIAGGLGWNITGAVGTFRAKSFTGSISAASLGSLITTGDFNGDLTLDGTGVASNRLTLGAASIGGTVAGSNFNVAGNVGTFTAKAFTDSDLFLGYTPDDPIDPMAGGTFQTGLKIASFSVTGLAKSADPAFSNSVVAADNIGAVTLKSVKTNNGHDDFGILAQTGIASVRVTTPGFMFNKKNPVPQGIGDFEVVIS